MKPSDLWWQTLADGPVLLALFDADGRLRLANAAYRAAWALVAVSIGAAFGYVSEILANALTKKGPAADAA